MTRPRRLVTLSASLALHSGVLLAVLLAVSGETELGALFIDLTESAVPEAAASNAATSTPAAAGRGGARAVRSIAAARLAPTPPVLRGAAEPSPAAEPASSRSPGAASPPPPPSLTSPELLAASGPDPAPQIAESADAAPHGASSTASSSSLAGHPDVSTTQGGIPMGLSSRGGVPGGAPDVSHGFALAVPGGGSVGPGGPGAEYGAYLGGLRQRIQQSLRYPLAARRRGLSGTVHVEIVIRPDGVIGGVAVADSSSHAILDDAAVDTIRRLAPAPFPSDVQPRTLRVRLPVVFALE